MTQLTTPDAPTNTAEALEMSVTLNGNAVSTGARTLDELLSREGFSQHPVATAVNGEFVPAGKRAECVLKAGDQIEVVSPRQGG